MNEPNPYEPPQTAKPLMPGQVVKRGLGVVAILLLTPPAMVATVMGSCTAARMSTGALRMLVMLGVPLAVLTGLMIWATALGRPRRGDPNQQPSRTGILLATPAVVALGLVIGYVLAMAVVLLSGIGGLRLYEKSLYVAEYVFWLPPAAALLAMLWIAWRAGRNTR